MVRFCGVLTQMRSAFPNRTDRLESRLIWYKLPLRRVYDILKRILC